MIERPTIDIAKTATVADTAIIGKRFRQLLSGAQIKARGQTYVRDKAYIGEYAIVGEGCDIGAGSILDDYTKLECDVTVGERCLFLYSAYVCLEAIIGNDCVIGGFVGDRATIGNNCRIFGKIVHRQNSPSLGWDDDAADEDAARIGSDCFVGFAALLIGPVVVEANSYIAAGSVVTKSVPSRTIVTGQNVQTPVSKWKGSLKESPIFRTK
jgi:acetyltransferase-like isoleucine patch superfamily enzyme